MNKNILNAFSNGNKALTEPSTNPTTLVVSKNGKGVLSADDTRDFRLALMRHIPFITRIHPSRLRWGMIQRLILIICALFNPAEKHWRMRFMAPRNPLSTFDYDEVLLDLWFSNSVSDDGTTIDICCQHPVILKWLGATLEKYHELTGISYKINCREECSSTVYSLS